VKLSRATDLFLRDMQAQGQINSQRTVTSYEQVLHLLAEDAGNHDMSAERFTRHDVKTTLRRWPNPNTQRTRRAVLVSFGDWLVEEGYREANPARQTRSPRARKPSVYHMTYEETAKFLRAARTPRERRVAYLGVCVGARRAELVGMQGRHFARPGWVWISGDIAKGGKERWVPVLHDLEPVVAEIQEHLELDHYVIPAQQFADPGTNLRPTDDPHKHSDPKTVWRIARRIGKRAGIAGAIGAHTMRRAFADHVARWAGVEYAQLLLGHADLSTTQTYLGDRTLDEVAASVKGTSFFAPNIGTANPHMETVGIEPTSTGNRDQHSVPDGSASYPIAPAPGPVDPDMARYARPTRTDTPTPNEEASP
jgi:site-specific recombinase XerD